jgi:hypothetical protein
LLFTGVRKRTVYVHFRTSGKLVQKWLQRRPDGGKIAKEDNVMTSGDQRHPGIPDIFCTLNEFIEAAISIPVSIH